MAGCHTSSPSNAPPLAGPPHTQDAPWLDGKHQVFGRVLDGMNLAEAISHVDTGPGDAPKVPVTIRATGEIRILQPGASAGVSAGATPPHLGAGAQPQAVRGRGALGGGLRLESGRVAAAAVEEEDKQQHEQEALEAAGGDSSGSRGPGGGGGSGSGDPEIVAGVPLDVLLASPGPVRVTEGPPVTQMVWLDLEQAGKRLGRVVLGL
jgi:hypothetical protein